MIEGYLYNREDFPTEEKIRKILEEQLDRVEFELQPISSVDGDNAEASVELNQVLSGREEHLEGDLQLRIEWMREIEKVNLALGAWMEYQKVRRMNVNVFEAMRQGRDHDQMMREHRERLETLLKRFNKATLLEVLKVVAASKVNLGKNTYLLQPFSNKYTERLEQSNRIKRHYSNLEQFAKHLADNQSMQPDEMKDGIGKQMEIRNQVDILSACWSTVNLKTEQFLATYKIDNSLNSNEPANSKFIFEQICSELGLDPESLYANSKENTELFSWIEKIRQRINQYLQKAQSEYEKLSLSDEEIFSRERDGGIFDEACTFFGVDKRPDFVHRFGDYEGKFRDIVEIGIKNLIYDFDSMDGGLRKTDRRKVVLLVQRIANQIKEYRKF